MPKLALYALVVLAIAGAFAGLRSHYIGIGVGQQRAAAAKALLELQRKADAETKRLQAKADLAEHAHDKELETLRKYRDDNPLHGGLCQRPKLPPATSGQVSADHSIHEPASAPSRGILAVPSRTAEPSGQSDPDVRGMLDIQHVKCDEVSAALREWQSR